RHRTAERPDAGGPAGDARLRRALLRPAETDADRPFAARPPNNGPYSAPAMSAPTIGATQNSHSWPGAPPPLKNATAVDRAGFTDVLVMGMEMRWISVSVRPMAARAKPTGARRSVAPRMTHTKRAVSTISMSRAESRP